MASIERKITINDVTPQEVAGMFASMFSDEQAAFFSEVGRIAKDWPVSAGWCGQSYEIAKEADALAVETIRTLAEHTYDQ